MFVGPARTFPQAQMWFSTGLRNKIDFVFISIAKPIDFCKPVKHLHTQPDTQVNLASYPSG